MIDQPVEDILRSLGLTAGYQGYTCLVYALRMVQRDPHCLELVTKYLYPQISRLCSLTVGGVDSAIRTAMRQCARRCGGEVARLCGVSNPTIPQFLAALAGQLPPPQSDEGGSER